MDPDEDAVLEQIELAESSEDDTRYPGLTYEQGVLATLRWMIGDIEDGPMEARSELGDEEAE